MQLFSFVSRFARVVPTPPPHRMKMAVGRHVGHATDAGPVPAIINSQTSQCFAWFAERRDGMAVEP